MVLNDIEKQIKEKIESAGIPLKDWDIQINYGIKTGFNGPLSEGGCFIITKEKRDELVKKCPKVVDIIRPILRGRDIQRFQANWDNIYLIAMHNGYTDSSGHKIEPIRIDEYPAIKKHLDGYWAQISVRQDKGVSPYHLRSCIYMEDFSKPKIIYPEITKFINFYYDKHQHFYVNNKCFILTGECIEFLTAFLNSSLFKFCFINNFPDLLGGTRELRKVFIEKIPVKRISEKQNAVFAQKITRVQELKFQNKSTSSIEREIDNLIFDLYGLTQIEKESIGYIEIT